MAYGMTPRRVRRAVDPGPNYHPAFKLQVGALTITGEAQRAMESDVTDPYRLLTRHATGDFGDLGFNAYTLHDCLQGGARIVSVYTLDTGARIEIATEPDRRTTTMRVKL